MDLLYWYFVGLSPHRVIVPDAADITDRWIKLLFESIFLVALPSLQFPNHQTTWDKPRLADQEPAKSPWKVILCSLEAKH